MVVLNVGKFPGILCPEARLPSESSPPQTCLSNPTRHRISVGLAGNGWMCGHRPLSQRPAQLMCGLREWQPLTTTSCPATMHDMPSSKSPQLAFDLRDASRCERKCGNHRALVSSVSDDVSRRGPGGNPCNPVVAQRHGVLRVEKQRLVTEGIQTKVYDRAHQPRARLGISPHRAVSFDLAIYIYWGWDIGRQIDKHLPRPAMQDAHADMGQLLIANSRDNTLVDRRLGVCAWNQDTTHNTLIAMSHVWCCKCHAHTCAWMSVCTAGHVSIELTNLGCPILGKIRPWGCSRSTAGERTTQRISIIIYC